MKYSIRRRLTKNFMIVILITVLILEVALINGIKNYYYKNVENLLENQLEFSNNYLSRYIEFNSIDNIVMEDIDLFWSNTQAQIQIFNNKGELILDSIGKELDQVPSDVKKALEDNRAMSLGESSDYAESVMSISKAIVKDGKTQGVLRFTTSMDETKEVVRYLTILVLVVGLIVIVISGTVSIVLSNSIVKPLKELTDVAEKMADGQLDVVSEVDLDDEIGKLSDTINYMAKEILKKEEIKNEFISSISHELKTPLTSIKGWAITLQYENLEEDSNLKEGLEIIEEESDRLSLMLEELLDFSRFVSGDISLRKQKINLNNVLRSIYSQLSPRASLNKLEFKLDIDDSLDYVMADKDRLRQVFINILDNAFKFSEEGGSVYLKARRQDQDVIINIIDQGIGISTEELPHIKEKFYKGKSAMSHAGLGLSICDEIISLHNGQLNISSLKDQGTDVEIIIPVGDIDEE